MIANRSKGGPTGGPEPRILSTVWRFSTFSDGLQNLIRRFDSDPRLQDFKNWLKPILKIPSAQAVPVVGRHSTNR
jgi:hypothetical protein